MSVIINCDLRRSVGTPSSKVLRKEGFIPAVVYGKGRDPISFFIKRKEFEKDIHSIFNNNIIELNIDNISHKAIAKSCDVHPINSNIIHVDFVFATDQACRFNVPVVFLNQNLCKAIKFGAVLNIVKRKILVKCTPSDLPKNVEIDVKDCKVGESIKVYDIKLPDNVELVTQDKKAAIATIIGKKSKAGAEDSTAPA